MSSLTSSDPNERATALLKLTVRDLDDNDVWRNYLRLAWDSQETTTEFPYRHDPETERSMAMPTPTEAVEEESPWTRTPGIEYDYDTGQETYRGPLVSWVWHHQRTAIGPMHLSAEAVETMAELIADAHAPQVHWDGSLPQLALIEGATWVDEVAAAQRLFKPLQHVNGGAAALTGGLGLQAMAALAELVLDASAWDWARQMARHVHAQALLDTLAAQPKRIPSHLLADLFVAHETAPAALARCIAAAASEQPDAVIFDAILNEPSVPALAVWLGSYPNVPSHLDYSVDQALRTLGGVPEHFPAADWFAATSSDGGLIRRYHLENRVPVQRWLRGHLLAWALGESPEQGWYAAGLLCRQGLHADDERLRDLVEGALREAPAEGVAAWPIRAIEDAIPGSPPLAEAPAALLRIGLQRPKDLRHVAGALVAYWRAEQTDIVREFLAAYCAEIKPIEAVTLRPTMRDGTVTNWRAPHDPRHLDGVVDLLPKGDPLRAAFAEIRPGDQRAGGPYMVAR